MYCDVLYNARSLIYNDVLALEAGVALLVQAVLGCSKGLIDGSRLCSCDGQGSTHCFFLLVERAVAGEYSCSLYFSRC